MMAVKSDRYADRQGCLAHRRRRRLAAALAAAVALSIGCGKSDEQIAAEKAAEEVKQAAEALGKAAESAASSATQQGMQEFAKAMEGMAGALGGAAADGKRVEPVSFQSLQEALPEVSGWQRATPSGERMTSPIPFSQAEADYTMGDASITVKIVDSAFSEMLVAPWAMFLTTGYERQTSEGYEKFVSVGGHPGFERWTSASKEGELNLVVDKRFLVTIDGENIADTKVLHEFFTSLDTSRLKSLE